MDQWEDEMSKIVDLPCSTTLDIPCKKIIENLNPDDYAVIFVIGENEDGDLIISSSTGNMEKNIYMLEKFKHNFFNGDYDY